MRILIIGGTRFMGPHIVRQLINDGHDITLFHRGQTKADLPESVDHIHGDRNKLPDYKTELTRLKPDVVLDMMLRTEAQAVDLMKTFDGNTNRVVIASSIDVYRNYGLAIGSETGNVYNARLTEDAPLRETLYPYRNRATGPDDWQNDYDKIPIEREILAHKSLPGTVLRLPMVYGPHDPQHRLYPYLKRMLDNRPAILLDEKQIDARWIRGYVENIAAGIALAVTDSRARDRIYNVCESSAMTELEWISHIAAIAGWSGKVVGLPKDKLPEHLREEIRFEAHLNADSRRIRNELGYKEIIDFNEGLKRTVAWEKDNQPPNLDQADYNYEAEDTALSRKDATS